MYRGVSSAYTIIVVSYWTLAFSGYWAFGSQVQPYILSSLTAPRWATVMANLFAVIQIAGCFQVNQTRAVPILNQFGGITFKATYHVQINQPVQTWKLPIRTTRC